MALYFKGYYGFCAGKGSKLTYKMDGSFFEVCLQGAMVKALDWGGEFKLQSSYKGHSQKYVLGKCMNSLILQTRG